MTAKAEEFGGVVHVAGWIIIAGIFVGYIASGATTDFLQIMSPEGYTIRETISAIAG